MPKIDWVQDNDNQPRWEPRQRRERTSREARDRRARLEGFVQVVIRLDRLAGETRDRLKLQGEASSFESVDKMKLELQKAPAFTDIQVLDTRMGVDNKVKFRFDIKLKQTM